MSTTEADGVEEAVKGALRVAMTAAARAGEHLAAMRAQELRRGAQESERAAEELRARYEAHRQAARAVLQDVHRADWWAKATAADIGRMYREATAWASVDGAAARAAERIVTEVRGRYGVSEDGTGPSEELPRSAAEVNPRHAVVDLDEEALRAHAVAAKGASGSPGVTDRVSDFASYGERAARPGRGIGRPHQHPQEVDGR